VTRTVVPTITACESTETLVVEVSNPGAIGEVTVERPSAVSSSAAQPFELIDSSVVGVAESSPIEVVTVYVGSNVSSVRASFSDGSMDQLPVQKDWAVLVDDGSSPLPARLTAFDAAGDSIGTASVSSDDAIAEPAQCLPPVAVARPGKAVAQPTKTSK
jgi:hypothetical protein